MKKLVKKIIEEEYTDTFTYRSTLVDYHYDTEEARNKHVAEMHHIGYMTVNSRQESIGDFKNPKYVLLCEYYMVEKFDCENNKEDNKTKKLVAKTIIEMNTKKNIIEKTTTVEYQYDTEETRAKHAAEMKDKGYMCLCQLDEIEIIADIRGTNGEPCAEYCKLEKFKC